MSVASAVALPTPAVSAGAGPVGVFELLESVFWSLCRGPAPLALPARLFGLPDRRSVRLAEARVLLLWPDRMDPDAKDGVWAELVGRAQTGGPSWVVGAAGVLLPGLRRVAQRLEAGYGGDREDLQAEVLAGFLTALRGVDADSGRLASRLCWAGYRAGLALRHRDTDVLRRRAVGVQAAAPPQPWGHPDFVLAAAVTAGVITAAEAELVGVTRLEGVTVAQAAAQLGVRRNTLLARRSRAERRLVAAIRTGELSGTAK